MLPIIVTPNSNFDRIPFTNGFFKFRIIAKRIVKIGHNKTNGVKSINAPTILLCFAYLFFLLFMKLILVNHGYLVI